MCNSEDTLARGQFFDLMYVNGDTLDGNRQYAYLRHGSGKMTLVVANFGDKRLETHVRIPQHALDCAALPHGNYRCTDLLTGAESTIVINDDMRVAIGVEPSNATLLTFEPTEKLR
jgi:hypothetical protein